MTSQSELGGWKHPSDDPMSPPTWRKGGTGAWLTRVKGPVFSRVSADVYSGQDERLNTNAVDSKRKVGLDPKTAYEIKGHIIKYYCRRQGFLPDVEFF